jgi:hypothetical protein
MFLKNSRYVGLETVETKDQQGRPVRALKRRPLPATGGAPYAVVGHDRLDLLAHTKYDDATRYWHIADANTELEAAELTRRVSRLIQVPEK